VIAGSSPDRGGAERLLQRLQAAGHSGEVVESTDYPGLRPGWFIVKAGRFDREADARNLVEAINASGVDAYYRRGDLARFDDGAATASKVLEPGTGKYDPRFAIDGDRATAWSWPAPAEGAVLTITYPSPRLITRIDVLPGYDKVHPTYGNVFFLNNRIKSIRFEFANGVSQTATLADAAQLQPVEVRPSVRSAWVRLVIESVYPGSRWTDTAISEVQVRGRY
jgi:hypothetical protein